MMKQLSIFDIYKDTSSIPQNNEKTKWDDFRFIDLFAGIGGIRLGFESVGGHCVFSSEFDEDACKTYEANFGEHPSGDITKIKASDIPDFDILLGGFPCQAFSIIGKKEGFANETCGTLFFEIERILKEKRPPAFMLENVRNLVAHDNGNTFKVIITHLEKLGYHVYAKVLNALDYGVPQKRERIYIVGFLDDVLFEFPDPVPVEKRKTLNDILEKKVDTKYYVRDAINTPNILRYIPNKKHPTAAEAAMRCNHSKSILLHHQKHTHNRHTDRHSHITFLRHKLMSLIPTSCKLHRMFPKEQDT